MRMSLFYTRFGLRVIIKTMNLTLTIAQDIPGQARPLNILRDLPAVADLIELCFRDKMDADGRSHIHEMRRHAHNSDFLNWAPHMVDVISLPLSGFVWEDGGKVVGNASLIPFHRWGRRIYLVANVATHPDYRGRGIGRILTEAAMQRAREKGANSLWLHVRDDNPAAIHIYRDLGFKERTRRTEWYASSGAVPLPRELPALKIRSRATGDWQTQRNWLERAYPSDLEWYPPSQQSWSAFGPHLWDGFYRLLVDIDVSQWSAEVDGQLRGVVSCRSRENRKSQAWLAAPPKPELESLTELLLHARRMFAHQLGMSLEYPAGPADEAIRAAGFSARRTLLWMEAPGQQPN
jgi:ribosomal protein S18 acetylase RimI-like enzyme